MEFPLGVHVIRHKRRDIVNSQIVFRCEHERIVCEYCEGGKPSRWRIVYWICHKENAGEQEQEVSKGTIFCWN